MPRLLKPLSPGQAQVARLLAQSHSYPTVAAMLGISPAAVVSRVNAAAAKWPHTDKRKPRVKLVSWAKGAE